MDADNRKFFSYLLEEGYSFIIPLPDNRWAAVFPFIYTTAIIKGKVGDYGSYDERWCYNTRQDAVTALVKWTTGTDPEPTGWHRHNPSNRRRPMGDPAQEFVYR